MVVIFIGLMAAVLFYIQHVLYKRWWHRLLEVDLVFQDEMVRQGERTILREVLENRKWLPLPALKVKFQCSKYLRFVDDTNSAVTDRYYRNDMFSVKPFRRITRSHEIICEKRGYYGIDGIDLVGGDLFWTEEMIDSRKCLTQLYVIPKAVPIQELAPALLKLNGEIVTRRQLLTDPFTYRGIREYSPFDEMRTINWKATARTQELKVNMQDSTVLSAAAVYLNLTENHVFRSEELREYAISLASYCMEYFLGMNVQADFYTNAKDIVTKHQVTLKGSMDPGHLTQANKTLARLDLTLPMETFGECFEARLKETQSDIFAVFISANTQEDFQQLLIAYGKKNSLIWLCPVEEKNEIKIFDELKPVIMKIPLTD